MDSVRKTSAIPAVIKSSRSHDMELPQIVTYMVLEKGIGKQSRTKVSFGRTMIQALWLAKRHISGQSDEDQ